MTRAAPKIAPDRLILGRNERFDIPGVHALIGGGDRKVP